MEARQSLEFLKLQYRALINVGIDIGARRCKRFLKHPWKFFYMAITTLYVHYGLFLYTVHIFNVKINKATSALSLFNQGSLLMFKLMVVILKSDRLLKLIWDMNLLATSANLLERGVWVSENRRAVLISKIYVTACWIALIFSGVIPIIIMSYQYFQGAEVHLKLPYDGEFPFEDRGIHIFILNYILSMVYVYILLNLSIGLDTLFGWCAHAVSAHFRILRIKVGVTASKIEDHDNHEDFLKDVGSIVRYHIKILHFIDEMNNVFGGIFWAEVMFSCLQMCFLIYSLNTDPDIQTMPFNVLSFAAISIQMMIYCFGGEKVKSENNMLCEDIYIKFPWDKMLPSERKLMLLPLMRSQQKASLVGIFFELDRNLLVYIYRTAFSFNTLLGPMKD